MEAQRDKFVSHSEVPVLCVSGSDVSLVGYKQQLVRCHDIEQGVIALVSFFYAFHIQFATKRSSFMHLLQHREMHSWEASFAADANSEYVTFVKSASQDCISPGLWIAYCLYCCMLIVWKTHRVCHTFCCWYIMMMTIILSDFVATWQWLLLNGDDEVMHGQMPFLIPLLTFWLWCEWNIDLQLVAVYGQ